MSLLKLGHKEKSGFRTVHPDYNIFIISLEDIWTRTANNTVSTAT